MSNDSERNSAVNAAATSKVYHAQFQDLYVSATRKFYRGGVRPGEASRTYAQAQEMFNKVPPSQRMGTNAENAARNIRDYLSDKDASHVKPHSKGGSNDPSNIKWENAKNNRARGNKDMSLQEQTNLGAKWHVDNLTGAVKAGVKATPMGAAIGAVTTAPFSMLSNGLRVVRGEMSGGEAVLETLKDTATGGAVGAASAFSITTVASACPPIAMALSAISPALLAVGGAGMVYEFFHILESHKQAVRKYYQSLTKQELQCLQEIEDELTYQHQKNLDFLAEADAINEQIKNRPCEPGIEGAVKRYLDSVAIAKSLGVMPNNSRHLPGNSQQGFLPTNS
ncbi:hypothetical protein [Dapis sp. BLCC M229]|uniref:hypothetical protein n=1 Tax=Dapis sp. BLCC M229 TaxID=3400188 RepID=UPI003CEAB3D6